MKNMSKLLGIIAVVAMMGFVMVSCDTGGGGGGGASIPSIPAANMDLPAGLVDDLFDDGVDGDAATADDDLKELARAILDELLRNRWGIVMDIEDFLYDVAFDEPAGNITITDESWFPFDIEAASGTIVTTSEIQGNNFIEGAQSNNFRFTRATDTLAARVGMTFDWRRTMNIQNMSGNYRSSLSFHVVAAFNEIYVDGDSFSGHAVIQGGIAFTMRWDAEGANMRFPSGPVASLTATFRDHENSAASAVTLTLTGDDALDFFGGEDNDD